MVTKCALMQGRISALEGPQRATDLDNARLYAKASIGKPTLVCLVHLLHVHWNGAAC